MATLAPIAGFSAPTKKYDIASLCLTSIASFLLLLLIIPRTIGSKIPYLGSKIPEKISNVFTGENTTVHTFLYVTIFLAVLVSTVLMCVDE